jgi:LacI family repressor for deo operon, udp, cdd, tsx, nupC, and nupG
MAARLAEIARHAGVSEATVSRVLNDKPGVAEATRVAVLTALDVLGYERPAKLRRRSAGLVGLITPELVNPIFPALAQGIESVLALSSFTPLLCTQTPGGVSEDEYVTTLLGQGVAGIIFVSGLHADAEHDHRQYHDLVERGLPIVCVNGYADDIDAPYISVDDADAMRQAVSHLAHLGHRRIGLAVGQQRYVPSRRKVHGFVEAVSASGLAGAAAAGMMVEHTLFSVEGGRAAANRLIDRGATAIICGSDLMALGAIRAACQRGLGVPDDISVVGFDDSPLMGFTAPALTTIRQPVESMAQAAAQTLLDAIAAAPVPATEYLYTPELIVRGSTAPPTAVEPAVALATRGR